MPSVPWWYYLPWCMRDRFGDRRRLQSQVRDDTSVLQQFLKLSSRGGTILRHQVGLTTDIGGIEVT
jgi:hypothetical protein